ncbi:hypothetical protein NMY22_g12523 [Coprinellus aureogranulatus]|nr:hypothetical protein NMY22_g12523 [Coprinellus aureogranulatus]
MQLILTTRDPYNANYCTPEGQVMYKVVSPNHLLHRRRATVDKVVPSGSEDMQDHFERIGEVEFHSVNPSVITYNNIRQGVDKFFRKGGALKVEDIGSDRIFTGPDGKEYLWKISLYTPALLTNDGTNTKVADFRQKDLFGFHPKSRPAVLEIHPAAGSLASAPLLCSARFGQMSGAHIKGASTASSLGSGLMYLHQSLGCSDRVVEAAWHESRIVASKSSIVLRFSPPPASTLQAPPEQARSRPRCLSPSWLPASTNTPLRLRALIITTGDPYNSNYCTEEGQVIYKVVSPFKLFQTRKATIDKVAPSDPEDMQDHFERIGEVVFHIFSPSIITFNNVSQSVNKFFRKKIVLLNLGSNRIFTGPDGKEYYWKLANTKPVLYTNDGTDTRVAKVHSKHYGIIGTARPATLEIFPAGEHMVDLIVVTLVYIEKLRREREQARRSHGGGGAGGGG